MGITDGGVISEVLPESQAFNAGVRQGWIIKELDGKPFNKAESLPLVRNDFDAAKSEAPSLIVKFDVMSSRDCTNGDCTRSDKLPVDSDVACAQVCSHVPACQWWTVGIEDGDKMCWLRSSDKGLRAMPGFSSGRQSCQPAESLWFSTWWIVAILAIALYFRKDALNHIHDLNIFQWLSGRTGTSALSTDVQKVPGYGAQSSKFGLQELARVDALVGTRMRTCSR